jgi:ligand-binding SRPBCC domain-containing protein
MPVTLLTKSVITASPEDVWSRVTHPAGINHELAPLMRMTVPKGLEGKTVRDVDLGRRICRSWFLLFGFIPFDYDDIVIAERENGRRFKETSSMLSIRAWEHERTLAPVPQGTEVTDRVTFDLRWPFSAIPGMNRLVAYILSGLFKHRHRRLARWFASHSVRE